jgi:hypothetical protein
MRALLTPPPFIEPSKLRRPPTNTVVSICPVTFIKNNLCSFQSDFQGQNSLLVQNLPKGIASVPFAMSFTHENAENEKS